MLSLRTGLFRSQPLNALTRQTVRVPRLVHWKPSHKPPTTIMGRAFSIAPKLLQAPAEGKMDMILQCTFETVNCTREEYVRLAELSARQEERDKWEKVKQTSDPELRMEMEERYLDFPDHWENIRMLDEKERLSTLEEWYEWSASSEAKRAMYNAGKEYDAQMARKKSQSNLTKAEIAKLISEEEARRRYEDLRSGSVE